MKPSTILEDHATLSKNPRRQPAHLSVSLRHDSSPTSGGRVERNSAALYKKALANAASSNGSSGSSRVQSSRKWFDNANENPKAPYSQALQDEPPYFLPQRSENSSDDVGDDRLEASTRYAQNVIHPDTGPYRSTTNASNASDFRSVIDDLTIQNKKLKERLKRLEKNHSPHLENERLFEVTIHGLSARKRRKLEEKLREFAATLEDSSGSDVGESPPDDSRGDYVGTIPGQKRSNGSSNSISRPPDSAYASMSNDAQNSSSNLTSAQTNGKSHGRHEKVSAENADNIESFLEGIPEGLLPKATLALTERQKQRIVVKRLEQLFTGKQGLGIMDNQLAQQQEVADSAARADDTHIRRNSEHEGTREAHMLPQLEMTSRPGNMPVGQSRDDIQNSSEDSPDSMDIEQEQRPTRPLDLDPDRAQVAADNVEYIRHLGLSTPQLLSEDSSDAEPDAQGWVYLNLLINMAQLHIINVTPDFVRRAVQDVSLKLQLSQDGNKLRWRGGSKGTKLSSSSDDASSVSPHNSDDVVMNMPKRRKIDSGRFATVPVNIERERAANGVMDSAGFHYRPMFNHQSTSTDTDGTSKTSISSAYNKSFAAGTGRQTNSSSWAEKARSGVRMKKRREDGTMVFYSNAQFCTDLAGDREIPTPLYLEPGKERGLNVRHILGADYRRKTSRLSRFDTSSVRTSRPHKAASLEFTQSDISDISVYGAAREHASVFGEDLQDFEACGLGGTQPADHFVVRVRTRRLQNSDGRKPTPSSLAKVKRRFLSHTVPRAALSAFEGSSDISHEEHLTANMATLSASSPPAQRDSLELPVEVEYISAKYSRLQPSELPDPMGFYGMSMSDDESSSYETESSASAAHQTLDRSRSTTNGAAQSRVRFGSEMDYDDDDDESEDEDDDDMSIDMLGHLRKIAPAVVAEREDSYDLRNGGMDVEVAASAAATVAESVDEP